MSSTTFLSIGAIIALVFGIAFLVAPSFVMTIYGLTSTVALTVAFRYFGATLVALALIVWPIRSCSDPAIVRPVLLGHGIGDIAGLIVSIWAVTNGTLNLLGWFNVLLYLGLIAGAATCWMASATRPLAAA